MQISLEHWKFRAYRNKDEQMAVPMFYMGMIPIMKPTNQPTNQQTN